MPVLSQHEGGSPTRSTWLRGLLVMVVAAVLAASCGSDSDPGSDAESADGGGSGETSRLVYGTLTELRALDFIGLLDPTAWSLALGNVIEPLTRIGYDDAGNLEWTPLLAESWEQIGPLQWRFHIEQGVTFHDGRPLTSADVAYTINKRMAPGTEQGSIEANLERAEVVDEYTVDVFTLAPDPFVERSLYRIGIEPDGWGEDNAAEAAETLIGTGPYTVESFSGDRAVIARWPDYRGEAPEIDEIELRVIPESGALLAALQTGEVQVAIGLSPDLLAAAPATLETPDIAVELLRVDTNRAPLDNVEVRQALNMAIDRRSLIDDIYSGFAEEPQGQIVPPQAFGFNDDLSDYEFDPERAREILEEHGATGTQLDLMCSMEQRVLSGDVCQAVVQMLNDVGLDVSLNMVSFDQWLEEGLFAPRNGLQPPALYHIVTSTDTLIALPKVTQSIQCGGERSTYCNPELQERLDSALALTDPDEIEEATRDLLASVYEEAPEVWLTRPQVGFGVAEGVEGVIYPQQGDVYWSEWRLA